MHRRVIGTAGHVDHGKTALVLALTGMDCDTHPQEKQRGLTINPGFAYLDDGHGGFLSFVDLPGHSRFISNMISGSMAVDYTMLVIAADDGIMPQTIEHLQICSLLGIRHGLVVINKSDLSDEYGLDMLENRIRDFVKGTFLENSPVFRTSCRTGQGIGALKDYLLSAVEDDVPASDSHDGRLFRMNVDRAFSVKGLGAVLAGLARGASVGVGDSLFLYPGEKEVKIKSVRKHSSDVVQTEDMERFAFNVSGISNEELDDVTVLSSARLAPVMLLDVVMESFSKDRQARFPENVRTVEVHVGMYRVNASIRIINAGQQDSRIYAQLALDKAVYAFRSDKILVSHVSSKSILAGGTILDTEPLVHKKKSAALVEDFRIMASGSLSDYIMYKIRTSSGLLSLDRISTLTSVSVSKLREILSADGRFAIIQDVVILSAYIRQFRDFLVQKYREHMEGKPICGQILTVSQLLKAASDFRIKPVPEEDRILKRILKDSLSRQGLLKENSRGLCVMDGVEFELPGGQYVCLPENEEEEGILEFLSSAGRFVKVGKYYFQTAFYNDCRDSLVRYLSENSVGISLPEFKEMSGLSRKQALALLDFLEAEGLLVRSGDVRILHD